MPQDAVAVTEGTVAEVNGNLTFRDDVDDNADVEGPRNPKTILWQWTMLTVGISAMGMSYLFRAVIK